MHSKFVINYNHDLIVKSKFIFVKNRNKKKALQYLKLILYVNLITSFTTIKNLFNYLKNIFNNSHFEKYAIEKFQELKIKTSLFDNFYFEYISKIFF